MYPYTIDENKLIDEDSFFCWGSAWEQVVDNTRDEIFDEESQIFAAEEEFWKSFSYMSA